MELDDYYSACPCCGNITIPHFGDALGYICPVCFWEIDPFCSRDEEKSDSNHGLTIIQARQNYQEGQACCPTHLQHCRHPKVFEVPDNPFHYRQADGTSTDFSYLSGWLDEYLNRIVGGEENRSQYIPYDKVEDIDKGVVMYDGDNPIACGGYKYIDQHTAEVKRVFMDEKYRGIGLSQRLMQLLEFLAVEDGFQRFILEAGKPLREAMSLYKKIGYCIIPNYGQHKNMPESICMEKVLVDKISSTKKLDIRKKNYILPERL